MADEVEDKTITYLFTRPIPRGAVLVGKYLAYLVCTSLVVLPSVMLVYFLLVPFGETGPRPSARWSSTWACSGLGLAVYGGGVRVRRRLLQAAARDRAGVRLRVGAGDHGPARATSSSSRSPTTSRPWCRTPCPRTGWPACSRGCSGRRRRRPVCLAWLAAYLVGFPLSGHPGGGAEGIRPRTVEACSPAMLALIALNMARNGNFGPLLQSVYSARETPNVEQDPLFRGGFGGNPGRRAGNGLVASYMGLPVSVFSSAAGPDELQYVPADAAVVAYANVRDVMNSEFRQRFRQMEPDARRSKRRVRRTDRRQHRTGHRLAWSPP